MKYNIFFSYKKWKKPPPTSIVTLMRFPLARAVILAVTSSEFRAIEGTEVDTVAAAFAGLYLQSFAVHCGK